MRHHRVDNRVAHKSTGGVLPWTPQPVDPVGNPVPLTPNTVALPKGEVRKSSTDDVPSEHRLGVHRGAVF